MICPITCGCQNSLVDIIEKTRLVSQILRATRKILENELIACFGHTAAITNKDEISELKKAQQDRNSDLYRTSIQCTVLGSTHGKEVCLVSPQDVSLLLQDRISTNLGFFWNYIIKRKDWDNWPTILAAMCTGMQISKLRPWKIKRTQI